jgi:hypothetical protein
MRRNIFLFTKENKTFYAECGNTVDYKSFKFAIVKFFYKNVLCIALQFYKNYFTLMNALV